MGQSRLTNPRKAAASVKAKLLLICPPDNMAKMKLPGHLIEKVVKHVNRKCWWHVPPSSSTSYESRGKFLASSFREAEFWGRPLDEPLKVSIAQPLVGDEARIERILFEKCMSNEDRAGTMEQRWKLDALMKKRAMKKGYDCIVLMSRKHFSKFKATGRLPRSLELNILAEP